MEERTLICPDITCEHCTSTIRRELQDLEGVCSIETDPRTQRVTLHWEPPATWEQIRTLLEEIGYPPKD